MRQFFLIALFFSINISLSAEEALKSLEEDYYDFLSIQGLSERGYLNYRTLSDSFRKTPDLEEGHLWQNANLGTEHNLFAKVFMRIYGPELFMSVNTAAPYGQNDGALWQGNGFNADFTAGFRFEAYGVEATFKPHLSFSQNREFDLMKPEMSGDKFAGKGDTYGYFWREIDAPQRFGDKPFWTFDWGDSEIRYTWKTLTVGFGTQPIWLGPAQINPIIHSNNAASYPKFDIGLRQQSVVLPHFGWHLGDLETRFWWGYLSESDWFDNEPGNDHNAITGFSVAYSFPYIFKGLTIGYNRVMLSKWDNMNVLAIFTLLYPRMDDLQDFGIDDNDQRASITVDYLVPVGGINIYFEWGRNDFSPHGDFMIRYPFHTSGYTFGIKKALSITTGLKGEILLETTNLEGSADYDRLINQTGTFYSHHIVTQGHTNRGQWLGAGIGTGGNSQYLGFKLYWPKGNGSFFIQRRNPDLDWSFYVDSKKSGFFSSEYNIKAFVDVGLSAVYFIMPQFSASASIVFRDEHNPLGRADGNLSVHRYNVYLSASAKYAF